MRTVPYLSLFAASLLFVTSAFAAGNKTYQVTGPVLEVTSDKIIVEKGKDKWEIARDGSSKVPADVKVGDKVTIEYRMTATNVEVKGASTKGNAKKAG